MAQALHAGIEHSVHDRDEKHDRNCVEYVEDGNRHISLTNIQVHALTLQEKCCLDLCNRTFFRYYFSDIFYAR